MSKKILIVDDDTRNIFALNAVLRTRGYTCVSAPAAAEAIRLLHSGDDIGVVLMDIMLPDMDGYEAIAHLRSDMRTASIPIIAVTAQAMVGDKEKCIEAGANGYVSKPVDVDALLHYLQQYLS
jgi:CheY-like chemotaxis protein